MPGKRRDFYVIVLNLNHLKSIGMAVVLEDGPGDAMFGMFSHFRPKITCVNGFGDEFRIHLQPKVEC